MRYASIADLRAYNGWHPVRVVGEQLGRVDEYVFQTAWRPIVDGDGDGSLTDDVKIYLDGEETEPSSIDPERGFIILETPPSNSAHVSADYFWHPIGDDEIETAIEAAGYEIEAATGIIFTPHERVERLKLGRGNEFTVSEPVITVQSVKVYDSHGKLLDDNAGFEVVNPITGLLRLKNYTAGTPKPPWYLTSPLEIETSYLAGYAETPAQVKQATILIATYWILLRLERQLDFGKEYGGTVATSFTSRELTERLKILRGEIERVKASLPKRVVRA